MFHLKIRNNRIKYRGEEEGEGKFSSMSEQKKRKRLMKKMEGERVK